MDEKPSTYAQPEVIESFDDLEILGDTPAVATAYGSATPAQC